MSKYSAKSASRIHINTFGVSEEDKTPTSYNALSKVQETTLIELANFLYSEYEAYGMDKRPSSADDEVDDPFIEIQEIQ